MSRKTIQISIPAGGAAPAAPTPAPAPKFASADAGADSWVAQAPRLVEPARVEILEPVLEPKPANDEGLAFTIRLSAQPDLFETAKIFYFLPQAALWFWGFGLAQRTLRGPLGPR
jgi:hypothetical protein